MAYVLEPMTHDDLPRILADAKTNPEIDRSVQMGFRSGAKPTFELSLSDKWAIDRENDSYLFCSRGLTSPKSHRDGYMFFHRGKAFGVYVKTLSRDYGVVSLSQDFSTPPPQDPDFQQAFSEACDVYCGHRLLGKVVFSVEQQNRELAT
jgi:hypothetical protein